MVEVVHPLHDPVLDGAGEADVVPGLEVRDHVAQPHPASVRTHRDTLREEREER